jgi:cytoskeletal protein CcmA (bactofilin family)
MKTIVNVITGTIRLDIDLTVIGMVRGDVIVPKGRRFVLNGIVSGDVVVEAGGAADIRGLVAGKLRNAGEASVKGFARRASGSLLDVASAQKLERPSIGFDR